VNVNVANFDFVHLDILTVLVAMEMYAMIGHERGGAARLPEVIAMPQMPQVLTRLRSAWHVPH
jgi:hypothetical protein